jgi:sugar lactone lactonase YvrE
VYVANTSAGAIYRVGVSNGRPSGHLTLVAHVRGADDFAVAPDGTVYIPSAGAVLKVAPDGTVTTLAQGCRGCDSALLADHGRTLYLVTHGFGPDAGPGTIYRLSLRGQNS